MHIYTHTICSCLCLDGLVADPARGLEELVEQHRNHHLSEQHQGILISTCLSTNEATKYPPAKQYNTAHTAQL